MEETTSTSKTENSAVVMTFNLRRASLLDGRNAWRYRKGSAADAILAADADFVGTQEGFPAMLRELDLLLPAYDWIGEGRMGGTSGETNAILFRADRWTPEESGTFWLSDAPDVPGRRGWGAAFPRICTWALFRSARAPSVRFALFNTHLDHVSPRARRHGAALAAIRLVELRRRIGAPAALTGDFNAGPRSEAVAQLASPPFGLAAANASPPGATYHGFRGSAAGEGRPIDFIFATDDCIIEEARVDRSQYRGRFPSDHYPVYARIRWT